MIVYILIFVVLYILFQNVQIEGFNDTKICRQYLKEGVHRYPCASKATKRHFNDWCNSFRRRQGFYLNPADSMSMFHRIHKHNLTFDLL